MATRATRASRQAGARRAAGLAPRAVAMVCAATLAITLSACGSNGDRANGPEARENKRTSVAIDYDAFYAPAADVRRLAEARAKEQGARLTFSSDRQGTAAQIASLKRFTGPTGGFGVVVVAPFDLAAVAAVTNDAIGRGVKVVSYLQPLATQTTGITVDLNAAADALTSDALKRLTASGPSSAPTSARGRVLVVVPPSTSPVPDPLAGVGRAGSDALLRALEAIGIRQPQTVVALGTADASAIVAKTLQSAPKITTILTWNDTTALGASQALGRKGYVGALAPGGVAAASTLRALRRPGSLSTIVAPRLSDLATALVDVPLALLRGGAAAPAAIPLQRFTKRGAATRAALADYAGG